jgi:trigger factor
MAEAYQMEDDKVKELLGENGKKQVMEDIAISKAVEFVVENAKEAKKSTKAKKEAEEATDAE